MISRQDGGERIKSQAFQRVRINGNHNGEKPNYRLILIENKNILMDELRDKIRVAHIVTVDYAADGKTILSQVSIFNFTTYKVCLAREFSGPRKDIKRGHFFNLYDRKIWPLETR